MVFPSVPIYLDPLNWPQEENGEAGGGCDNNSHQLSFQPPLAGRTGGGGVETGSIKPDYMADRTRMAKVPQPEAALKCPRCESTNTKFCYFNNYSLTQPRHFCKTCRRYWTRGGALRNVPVGGGCRRNKRSSKGSRSKSPVAGDNNNYSSTSTNSVVPPPPSSDVMTHFPPRHLPNFLTQLNQNRYGGSGDMAGLSFGGIQVGGVRGNENNNNDVAFPMNIGGGFAEQWRLQQGHHQYPFMNGMETAAPATGNMYTFEPEAGEPPSKAVKEESNNSTQQGLDLSRNFLGISGGGGNQYWGGAAANAWTELAGFTNSSSSTRHIL